MEDLAVILASRVPIVVVETHEEQCFLDHLVELFRQAADIDERPLFCWTVTDGLRRMDKAMGSQQHNADPTNVLKHIRSVRGPGVYVLLDFHPFLEDPVHQRLLKDIAVNSRDGRRTVILLSHAVALPADIERMSARFEMQLPNAQERARLIAGVVAEWNKHNRGKIQIDRPALDQLVRNLSGLTRTEVERLARRAAHDGAIAADDMPELMQAKQSLLNRDGVLTYEADTEKFASLAGLNRLKVWLEQRRRVLAGKVDGLDPPRGLLLIGVQGCGKSLAAKVTAGMFELPLLRLDMAAVYNKFHGETERQLRESLRQAELMAPCVLWIDEIEKGFATGEGDSGTSQRVLGSFLTWMAEKTAPVFVIATANDVRRLPPELVRKGRFDELFFVDLPTLDVRQKILEIHLRNRGLEPKSFDLRKMARASHDFSGAELEQAVVAALYAAHAQRKPMTEAQLLAEFMRTRPLAVVMAERVGALRQWAEERCVPADVVS